MSIELPRWLADASPALIGFIVAGGGWFLAKHARSDFGSRRRTGTPAE